MAGHRLGRAQRPLHAAGGLTVPFLVVLFVITQLVEIWILIQVGQAIGGWQTLGLLVLDSLLGAALLRHEGRRTWRAFRLALQERRIPAREVADGVLVLIGGVLLVTPGFLSDIVGVLCLLPPTRALLRPRLTRLVASRLGLGAVAGGGAGRTGARRRTSYGDVIDGEVVDGDAVEREIRAEPTTREGPSPGGDGPGVRLG